LIPLVRTNLEQCGYSDGRLRTDYVYDDGTGERTVALAGFARPVYDSRTSCISVIRCKELLGATEEYVNQFRGFGAPVIFVCCNGTLQWWSVRTRGAKIEKTILKNDIKDFFSAYKNEFSPDRIWRAKNLGRVDTKQQLSFVDIGLMPLLEHEMGERLGGVMNRSIGILHNGFTNKQLKMPQNQQWIFRAAFWLLCAKILKDKCVNGFLRLDLSDVDNVLKAVENHYRANPKELVIAQTKQQDQALKEAAEEIKRFASLSNLTTEAFAYMYENVLVDENLRDALGIHATPSYIVDYIVWQLWPWIEEHIPEDKRVVLEPACGHAPFLTAAMRMLRFSYGEKSDFHKYATQRLIGIETDSFAREIARLSLTLADVPNPNGWNIAEGDIYKGDILIKKAEKARILLCNPPFENFTQEEQRIYKRTGQKLNSFNKAAEILWRTLSYLREESVFGVILPRGFLHKNNLSGLRKTILKDFELFQICELPENVFTHAKHKSALLIGRKSALVSKTKAYDNKILYKKISASQLEKFREKYESRDQVIIQSKLCERPSCEFWARDLEDIWEYCGENYPILGSVVRGGKGFDYKGKELPKGAKTFDKKRFPGTVKGYAVFDNNIMLHGLPREYWLNLDSNVIASPRWGTKQGECQIIMNYARTSSGPWRIKALVDQEGRPVTSRFLVFRVKDDNWLLYSLWAILNSPLSNAYMYCNSIERDNLTGTVRKIPIPSCTKETLTELERMVAEYFELMRKKGSGFGVDIQDKSKNLLLSIDAEVMRLYNLPPKMEKRILDLFQGIQKKGVDFEFKGYYPEGFESAIPLHEYLSEEYQRSTVEFVDEWVKKHRSPEINKVLMTATEAFEEK
jgi:type I restriction-modification system DNA methylase subunit